MSSTEEILAAARKRFKTKEIDLGDGAKISVRELTPAERTALDDRLWEKGPDGKFVTVDEKGQPSTEGEVYYKTRDGADIRREWLLATVTPAEVVPALLGDDVPNSLKDEIFTAARAINGFDPASIAKNS